MFRLLRMLFEKYEIEKSLNNCQGSCKNKNFTVLPQNMLLQIQINQLDSH